MSTPTSAPLKSTSAQSSQPLAKRLQTPADAIRLAWADLQTVAPINRPYMRYLWIQDGSTVSMRTASYALNVVSRGSVIQHPLPVAGGHLLRCDLRAYAPQQSDLAEWATLWEEFAFDPAFALLLTRDTLKFSGRSEHELPTRKVRKTVTRPGIKRKETRIVQHPGGVFRYADDSGRPDIAHLAAGKYQVELLFQGPPIVDVVETDEPALATADVVRLDGGHLERDTLGRLQAETCNLAPVVNHRYFLTRALSTIRDRGVYRDIFGGLYYRMRGIKRAKEVLGTDTKATDLDLFFERLGIGNIKAGVTAESLFDNLRSDQRAAVFRSGITGKPRDVSMFQTPAARDGSGWGAITGDVRDRDVDIGDRAYANLLTPRRQAREAIFPTRINLVYALFDGQGGLVDEVPPDVAVDRTVPGPHTQRLQSAIGCIRCHGPNDQWQPLDNDARRLLSGRLDILGEIDYGRSRPSHDVLDRLAGLYAGDFSKHLRRARDDVAEMALRAAGPWPDGGDQTGVAKRVAEELSREFAEYNYDLVTPVTALRELGFAADDERLAARAIDSLVPPDAHGGFTGLAFILEDPRIAALKHGIGINRADWSLSYGHAAQRARRTIEASGGPDKWLKHWQSN